jgi:hypothetical protein
MSPVTGVAVSTVRPLDTARPTGDKISGGYRKRGAHPASCGTIFIRM